MQLVGVMMMMMMMMTTTMTTTMMMTLLLMMLTMMMSDVTLFPVRRVPPHFSVLPESIEVVPGGSVNLTCVAVGSPMPYVKWRQGPVDLTQEENMPIGKNILMLTDVRESSTYTCVATSELGSIEFDAEVKVKGRSGSDK